MVVHWTTSEYTPLYGGVVAQAVQNVSQSDADVVEAVELAAEQAKLTAVQYSVSNIQKQRLYFTRDGISPFQYNKLASDVEGKRYTQKSQIVMGLMYSFTIRSNGTTPLPDEEVEFNFTVSRDRNKEYHVFKQVLVVPASVHLETSTEAGTCGNRRTHLPCLFSPHHNMAVSFSSAQSLRVASYNIWNVNSLNKGEDYETRLHRLTRFISSLSLDVLGLQEVRLEVTESKPARTRRKSRTSTKTQSQISDLARALPGYHFVYQPAMLYMEKFQERKEEGLALFSRYPILSSDYKLLHRNESDAEDNHQRICLHAQLDIPQMGPVHVFVSHLSLSQRAQERSVVEIWTYMQTFSGVKLLMGDMNAEAHSKPMRFLTGEVPVGSVWTSELYDAWMLAVAASSDQAGLTFSAVEDNLSKRIDYIFASLPSGVHVSTSEVVEDETICSLPCSDHHLVLTVISVQSSPS